MVIYPLDRKKWREVSNGLEGDCASTCFGDDFHVFFACRITTLTLFLGHSHISESISTISSCYASCKHQSTMQDFRSMFARLHGRCVVICELRFAERTYHLLQGYVRSSPASTTNHRVRVRVRVRISRVSLRLHSTII